MQDFSKISGTTPDIIGECITYTNGQKEIIIDEEYWNAPEIGDGDREELIFHELGHCQLGLVHVNTLLPNGMPTTIMNAQHFSGTWYELNRNYYLTVLFE